MTAFDPRHSIDHLFQILASRLDPIIESTLAPHLGGLEWPAILRERDRVRGRSPGTYARSDPQAQLKVLTEKLGMIGYPFDDHTRTVSVLGGELRIARNRWAHHGELTALDGWRTGDFVVRLLERLGDAEGADAASQIRESAFYAIAAAKGIAGHAEPVSSSDADSPLADASFAIHAIRATTAGLGEEPDDQATPPVFCRKGEADDPFEPWIVVAVGGPDVIDGLPKKVMKDQVRAVAAEIIDFEGPIQMKRLAQLTAASFGIQRLREQREKRITYQISRIDGIVVDKDKFVWPSGIDPDTWRKYRPNDADLRRDFLAISPVEIANAMRALQLAGERDLDRAVLRVFGKSRLTQAFRHHLAKARKLL